VLNVADYIQDNCVFSKLLIVNIRDFTLIYNSCLVAPGMVHPEFYAALRQEQGLLLR
jgi:hypothetical protein